MNVQKATGALLLCSMFGGCAIHGTSSGPVIGLPLQRQLAFEFKGHYEFDKVQASGDTQIADAVAPAVNQYGELFATRVKAEFPPMLAVHGIATPEPQRGQPLLFGQLTSYFRQCTNVCRTTVDVVVKLFDANGTDVWTFRETLSPDYQESGGMKNFEAELLAALLRDHVIADGAAPAAP